MHASRDILDDIAIDGPELFQNPLRLVFGQGWTRWRVGLEAEDDSASELQSGNDRGVVQFTYAPCMCPLLSAMYQVAC